MFKKRCTKCEKKIDRSFDFCPYCGFQMRDLKNQGLLGKNDNINELNNYFEKQMSFGGFGNFSGSFMEKMLGNAFKMLEKEMRNLNKQENAIEEKNEKNPMINPNFQLYIKGKRINIPEFQQHLKGFSNEQRKNPKERQQKIPEVSQTTLEKSKKLPRKEAKTKLTRHKEGLIYELDTPGLESLNNVLVNKLENSIEIKAYTDKAVFFKTLPVKFPLTRYSINPQEGKLILEFKA